jgi:hypothetical protein
MSAVLSEDGLEGSAGADEEARAFDLFLQHRAGVGVELGFHQLGHQVDDGDVHAGVGEDFGGLESEEPAAEHDGVVACACLGAHLQTVVERAIGKEAGLERLVGQRGAVNRGDERTRAGGEDGDVIGDFAFVGGVDESSGGVESVDANAANEGNLLMGLDGGLHADGVGVFTGQHPGEEHAVVGMARLFAEEGDVIASLCVAAEEFLKEPRAGHAVADDGQMFLRHRCSPMGWCRSRIGPHTV